MYKRKYINPEIDLSESIIKQSSGENLAEVVKNHLRNNVDIDTKLDSSLQKYISDSKKSFIPMAALGMSIPNIADWHKQTFGKNAEYSSYGGRKALVKQGYRELVPTIEPIIQSGDEDESTTSSTTVAVDTPAHTVVTTPVTTPEVATQTGSTGAVTQSSTTPKTETIDYSTPGDSKSPGYMVISKEDMTIKALDTKGRVIYSFPIAVGRNFGNKREKGDMKTPEGTFSVQQIQDASKWSHDFGDGKGNIAGAYGPWFIRLNTPGHSGIGIHGTHDPASMGTRASEGCIRLRNEDIAKLRSLVTPGMKVVIQGSRKDYEADGATYVTPQAAHTYASQFFPASKVGPSGRSVAGGWKKPNRDRANIPYNVVGGYNIGHMKAVTDLMDKYGIKYRVASGVRTRNVGASGGKSWHFDGRGLDIAAPKGMANDQFLKQFVGNKAFLDELKGLNYGILNEYIGAVRAKTKGTGPHLHIGPDTWAWENHAQFYNPNMSLYSYWT